MPGEEALFRIIDIAVALIGFISIVTVSDDQKRSHGAVRK